MIIDIIKILVSQLDMVYTLFVNRKITEILWSEKNGKTRNPIH